MCDEDSDNDGIPDTEDNCPIVANPGQEDADGDSDGDACEDDYDGDGVMNADDVCPYNDGISMTDFRAIQSIDLGNNGQPKPKWTFTDQGKEIDMYRRAGGRSTNYHRKYKRSLWT